MVRHIISDILKGYKSKIIILVVLKDFHVVVCILLHGLVAIQFHKAVPDLLCKCGAVFQAFLVRIVVIHEFLVPIIILIESGLGGNFRFVGSDHTAGFVIEGECKCSSIRNELSRIVSIFNSSYSCKLGRNLYFESLILYCKKSIISDVGDGNMYLIGNLILEFPDEGRSVSDLGSAGCSHDDGQAQ